MAYKTFVNGFPLNASEINNNLMNQVISTFADSAARSTAIETPVEGQVTYLTGTNDYWKWDGAAWVELEALSPDFSPTTSPNYIINGSMDVWQRGTSFTNFADNAYTADRWGVDLDASPPPTTYSVTRESFTAADLLANGFGEAEFFFRFNCTTNNATDFYRPFNKIENVRTLAGQTVTLSYYARASAAAQTQAFLLQNFGSGGSTAVAYNGTATELSTTWQRFSFTFTLASMSGKTIGAGNNLEVRLGINSPADGSTFDIWGVQLEAGSVATPFKRNAPDLGLEELACKRYFQRLASTNAHLSVGYAGSTTAARFVIPTEVKMRSTPTITHNELRIGYGAFANNTPSTVVIQNYSGNMAEIRATASSAVLTAGEAVVLNTSSLSGNIDFISEL